MHRTLLICLSIVDLGLFIAAIVLMAKAKAERRKFAERNVGEMLFDISITKGRILVYFGIFFGFIFVIDKVMSVITDFYGLNISGLAFLFIVWLYQHSVELKVYQNVIAYKLYGRYGNCNAVITPDEIQSIELPPDKTVLKTVTIRFKSGDGATIPTSPRGVCAVRKFCRINNIECI